MYSWLPTQLIVTVDVLKELILEVLPFYFRRRVQLQSGELSQIAEP